MTTSSNPYHGFRFPVELIELILAARGVVVELRREPSPGAFVCHSLLLEFEGSLANPPPPGGEAHWLWTSTSIRTDCARRA
ncbi:MAG: hypothetical protein ACJ8AI_17075, partial [Rhodopila sp.]